MLAAPGVPLAIAQLVANKFDMALCRHNAPASVHAI